MRTAVLIVSFIGFFIFSASAGFVAASASGDAHEERFAFYADSARACRGTDALHSMACASWFATEVAAEAADYSWWQVAIGSVGAATAALALVLTAFANITSRQSLDLARRNAQIELRAYVAADGFAAERVMIEQEPHWIMRPLWRNAGQTPAWQVTVSSALTIDGAEKFERSSGPGHGADIGSSLQIGGSEVSVPEDRIVTAITRNEPVHLTGTVTYSDVFGSPDALQIRLLLLFAYDAVAGPQVGNSSCEIRVCSGHPHVVGPDGERMPFLAFVPRSCIRATPGRTSAFAKCGHSLPCYSWAWALQTIRAEGAATPAAILPSDLG